MTAVFGQENPAQTQAYITGSTVTAGGDLELTAESSAQVNATVSNAASSAASALVNAVGQAWGFIVATNRVSSTALAYVDSSTATVTGDATLAATDAAGIYANIKLVSSSITTNDGGAALAQGAINSLTDVDFLSSDPAVDIHFGQRVRIASDYAAPAYTSSDGQQDLVAGDNVQVADDFGSYRLTSASGTRLLISGDNVQDGSTVYRYLGDNGLTDLGAEDYSDTSRWAALGGEAGSVYHFIGTPGTVDLSAEDYSDAARWQLLGGTQARSTSTWARRRPRSTSAPRTTATRASGSPSSRPA